MQKALLHSVGVGLLVVSVSDLTRRSASAFSVSLASRGIGELEEAAESKTQHPKEMRDFVMKNMPTKPPPVEIPEHLQGLKVLGLGIAGLDFIAQVDSYPQPDEKTRSTGFTVMGGGNCANSLTAVRRLGLPCAIACKLGQDNNGATVLQELSEEGINTDFCVTKPVINSPFTYIIVDERSQTRTCIHTPMEEELKPDEVSEAWLDDVSLVHLDSRFTLAAIRLAKLANRRNIPVVLDVEKERPHIRELIPLANVIITNDAFPSIFLPGKEKLQGMRALLEQGVAHTVISTEGAKGSVLLRRAEAEREGEGPVGVPEGLVNSQCVQLGGRDYEVVRCQAWPVPRGKIKDTTGAGDAFIGGVIYGLVTHLSLVHCMLLGARIAAGKLQQPGARAGLARREEVEELLLAAPASQSG